MPYLVTRGYGVNVLIHIGTSHPMHQGFANCGCNADDGSSSKSGFQSQLHSSRAQPVDGVNALEHATFSAGDTPMQLQLPPRLSLMGNVIDRILAAFFFLMA
jgi:hypothetical protein